MKLQIPTRALHSIHHNFLDDLHAAFHENCCVFFLKFQHYRICLKHRVCCCMMTADRYFNSLSQSYLLFYMSITVTKGVVNEQSHCDIAFLIADSLLYEGRIGLILT